MTRKSPKDRVVKHPFQMAVSWLVKGGYLTTYKSWDDPPSTPPPYIPL